MNPISMIIDAIFLCTVIYIVWKSYKQGFLKSLIRTVGYLASSILAFFGSRILSDACYQLFFRDRLQKSIEDALIASAEQNDFATKIGSVMEGLPKIVQNLLQAAGLGADALADRLSGSVEDSAHELSLIIQQTVLYPIIISLLRGITFLILFTAAMILVRCLIKAVGTVRHIPLIGSVNALLGGVMGILQALVIWLVVAVAISFVIDITGGYPWLNHDSMQESLLFGKFYQLARSFLPNP